MKTSKIWTVKKRIFWGLLIQILIFSTPLVAQEDIAESGETGQAKIEEVKKIESRILLIELYGDSVIDKDINELMNKNWTFNKQLQFVNSEHIPQILKNNETKYAVLTPKKIVATIQNAFIGPVNVLFRLTLRLGENYDKVKSVYYQDIDFHEINNNIRVDDIKHLSKTDICFSINYIQNHLYARKEGKKRYSGFINEVVENQYILENKILLIDEDKLDKELNKNDISKYYTFPFKLTNQKEIENAFLTKDKRYAYVQILPYATAWHIKYHIVVDCETSFILSFGDFHNGAFDNSFSNEITRKHLLSYQKYSCSKKKK